MSRRVLLLSLALSCLVAGCATVSGPQGILGRIFGRKASAAAKAEAKATELENGVVTFAHAEVFKTSLALSAAPQSLPVDIARRTNTNALELLNQREPLAAQVAADAREIVEGLLAQKAEAEVKQKAAEATSLGMAQKLQTIRKEALRLAKQAEAEAQRNLELANQLRWANIIKWSGIAASTIFGLLAIAYRLNIGRLQSGVANVIATVQQKHGQAAGEAARGAADAILHTGEQKGVARAFFALTKT